ncbi:hypothetical protein HRbin36_01771 [bacterium HR36]|nr:hypothetical protein HRbin36_01771 [bacterium HR36]
MLYHGEWIVTTGTQKLQNQLVKWLLLIALIGYGLWLALLAWLASTSPDVVISRPQLELAPLVIVGRVLPDGAGGQQVRVVERIKPHSQEAWQQIWQSVRHPVNQDKPTDLKHGAQEEMNAEAEYLRVADLEAAPGWQGIGDYVLFLMPSGRDDRWALVPIPRSAGEFVVLDEQPRIYPATPGVLRQVRAMLAHEK